MKLSKKQLAICCGVASAALLLSLGVWFGGASASTSPAAKPTKATELATSPASTTVSSFDLPLFHLLDHHDNPFSKSEIENGLIIIFVGSNVREQCTLWSDYVSEHLPAGCVQANVLDLRHMSTMMKKVVTMGIDAESKEEPSPVWLDWEGTMATHFGFSLEQFNMVCLDAQGNILRIVHEDFSEQLANEVLDLYASASGG